MFKCFFINNTLIKMKDEKILKKFFKKHDKLRPIKYILYVSINR